MNQIPHSISLDAEVVLELHNVTYDPHMEKSTRVTDLTAHYQFRAGQLLGGTNARAYGDFYVVGIGSDEAAAVGSLLVALAQLSGDEATT